MLEAADNHSLVLDRLGQLVGGKTTAAGDRSRVVEAGPSGVAGGHLELAGEAEVVLESSSVLCSGHSLPRCTGEVVEVVVAARAVDEAAEGAPARCFPGDVKDCRCYITAVTPQAELTADCIPQVGEVKVESPPPEY